MDKVVDGFLLLHTRQFQAKKNFGSQCARKINRFSVHTQKDPDICPDSRFQDKLATIGNPSSRQG